MINFQGHAGDTEIYGGSLGDNRVNRAGWFYQDPISKCRMFTFKDLWSDSYYVYEGSKFVGDFLVYCGDPVKYHAKYIVICLESR